MSDTIEREHREAAAQPLGLLDAPEEVSGPIVLRAGVRDPGRYPVGTFRKMLTGMITLAALIVATYVVPALSWARPWNPGDPALFWNVVGREFLGDEATDATQRARVDAARAIARIDHDQDAPIVDRTPIAPRIGPKVLPPYVPHVDDGEPVPQSLEMPAPDALDGFFAALARTEAGYANAVTRATHWGDSVIANDNVTSSLREFMQRRFGDAGHGFHLLAKPNSSYRHRGVEFSGGEAWSRCYIINNCKRDGHYGLGGTTVWSAGGASSTFRTATETSYGRKFSRVELWYMGRPKGGSIRITLDDDEPQFVATDSEVLEDRWYELEATDGPHRLDIRAGGGGRSRLHGVVLERNVPGVVWDGMAQLGAFTSRLLNFDPDHLHAQLDRRDPDLLVFQFGGNDLLLKKSQMDRFKEQFTEVLQLFRGTKRRACLVVSPVDHGERRGGRIVSVEMMGEITEAQRTIAQEQGCAFFDTRAAMGGEDSVASWRRSRPPLLSGDLAHLTNPGQRVIGRMIYLALMEGYRAYRASERVPGSARP